MKNIRFSDHEVTREIFFYYDKIYQDEVKENLRIVVNNVGSLCSGLEVAWRSGYAGGILSAGIDGIKIAEAMAMAMLED